jgi:uncharacterized protein (TIGR02246 family)
MNRYMLVVLSIAILLGFSPRFIEAKELRDEIEMLLNAYVTAEQAQDPASIMNLMSRRTSVTSVTQGRILSGRTAIQRESELAAHSQKPPKISLNTIAVSPLGEDYALAVAEYTVRVHLTRGPLEFQGVWTVVLERTDGEWKILHEHHSDQ